MEVNEKALSAVAYESGKFTCFKPLVFIIPNTSEFSRSFARGLGLCASVKWTMRRDDKLTVRMNFSKHIGSCSADYLASATIRTINDEGTSYCQRLNETRSTCPGVFGSIVVISTDRPDQVRECFDYYSELKPTILNVTQLGDDGENPPRFTVFKRVNKNTLEMSINNVNEGISLFVGGKLMDYLEYYYDQMTIKYME